MSDQPCARGCLVEGCDRPRKYRHHCGMHQRRIRATGDAGPTDRLVARIDGTLADRLWSRVDRTAPDACWPFVGGFRNLARGGYGQVALGDATGRKIGAHRAAWLVTHGPIPAGITRATGSTAAGRPGARTTPPRSSPRTDVRAIRAAVEVGAVQRRVAASYGVSASLVSLIVKRKVWITV